MIFGGLRYIPAA